MPALVTHADCVSSFELDRYFAGNANADEQRVIEGHLEQCVRCAVRRDVILADREKFLGRVPTWDAMLTRRKPRSPRRIAAVVGVLLSAAAALALVFMPKQALPAARSKGGPHLGAYIKRGERVTRAQSGDHVRPDDWLRLTYTSTKQSQFAVLHRDAHGANIYYPLSARTIAIEPGRDVALDFGIRLDGEPGEEQLFGLFCKEELALEPLRAALQSAGQLPKLSHCQIDTLVLTKVLEAQ